MMFAWEQSQSILKGIWITACPGAVTPGGWEFQTRPPEPNCTFNQFGAILRVSDCPFQVEIHVSLCLGVGTYDIGGGGDGLAMAAVDGGLHSDRWHFGHASLWVCVGLVDLDNDDNLHASVWTKPILHIPDGIGPGFLVGGLDNERWVGHTL